MYNFKGSGFSAAVDGQTDFFIETVTPTRGTATEIISFNPAWQGEPAVLVLDSQLAFIYIFLI